MSFNAISENKILMKISKFTVTNEGGFHEPYTGYMVLYGILVEKNWIHSIPYFTACLQLVIEILDFISKSKR